ncbi:TIM barrel protein [Paenibacillus cremeus]|uniref:Sugar phosphate isomerase/epimerase n=1 Tax=Paenibacillus cremeus TaxID=2163881 RepID=A0A559KE86_9BACL|nr:TIM barrel protein [Paenibacillus cremeus]TVY10445.1 sugar phosphate isomerase/epimerase [Paenibacillus cremeus]
MEIKLTMLNSMASRNFTEALECFVRWGLDVVDLKDHIFGKSLIHLTDEETEAAAKALEERGLQAYCLSSELFYDDIEKGEAHFRSQHLERLERLIAIARRMRPAMIRLLAARSTQRASFNNSMTYIRQQAPWLIPMYQEAIDRIAAAGFQTTIENECRDCILATPTEVTSFFQALARPGKVHFTYDVQNLWEMGTFPTLEVYRTLKPLIGYLHLKGGRTGAEGERMVWKSSLQDASWPVAAMVAEAVRDQVSPVLCLNASHGKELADVSYEHIVEQDLSFTQSLVRKRIT